MWQQVVILRQHVHFYCELLINCKKLFQMGRQIFKPMNPLTITESTYNYIDIKYSIAHQIHILVILSYEVHMGAIHIVLFSN